MDSFGHVNNACFLTYFEEARISFMNELVGYQYDWSKRGLILGRAEVDFRLPAHFRDEIFVYVWCPKIGTKSFALDYEVVKLEDGKEITLANGKSVVVMYDYTKNASIEVPEEWKKLLLP